MLTLIPGRILKISVNPISSNTICNGLGGNVRSKNLDQIKTFWENEESDPCFLFDILILHGAKDYGWNHRTIRPGFRFSGKPKVL